ncbi:MAG: MFS transporter [Acidimicrobiales bacterium]
MVGSVAAGLLLLACAFVVQELRAPDPVMPLRLLRMPVVRSCAATTFLIGSVNFLVVAFLPLMLQVVTGVGSTEAGLAILPTTFGIAVTSTAVGRLVVRTGHYRSWPVLGSVVFTAGFAVLASLGSDPSRLAVWSGTGLLGIGMGAGTPVFMLAMQNAVAHRDVGVVSSTAMFARNTGQAFGTAIGGALFAARLTDHLHRLVSPTQLDGLDLTAVRGDIPAIRALDAEVQALVAEAFRLAVTDVFTVGVVMAALSVAVAATIPQLRLRETLDSS